MPNYFDDYKKRVQAGGINTEDTVTKASIVTVNNAFPDSSSYALVVLNGVNKEARVTLNKDSKIISVLYRPQTISQKGDTIQYNGYKWLAFDVINHEIYPKVKAHLCNESLKWKDASKNVRDYGAIILSGGVNFGIYDADKIEMNTLEGELRAYVQYNSFTKAILPTQRFIIGSQVYEVKGMDDVTDVVNGSGLIRFSLRLTTKKSTDDFVNKIADNSHVIKTTGQGGGGGLW